MATLASVIDPQPARDSYRLGDGPEPVLQPGTVGWSVDSLADPLIRRLWDQGRFEIVEGVLTTMPPAYFTGGEASQNLIFLLRDYCRAKSLAAKFSVEVEIKISDARVLRADAAVIIGDDLSRFESLRSKGKQFDWRNHALALPPTLIIESISQGHEFHDRQTKRRWYAELGVRHYWIVDAFTRRLDCLLLKDGDYVDDGHGQNDHTVSVKSMEGFTVALNDIWNG